MAFASLKVGPARTALPAYSGTSVLPPVGLKAPPTATIPGELVVVFAVIMMHHTIQE